VGEGEAWEVAVAAGVSVAVGDGVAWTSVGVAVGTGVSVGSAIAAGTGVDVGGMAVSVGTGVKVGGELAASVTGVISGGSNAVIAPPTRLKTWRPLPKNSHNPSRMRMLAPATHLSARQGFSSLPQWGQTVRPAGTRWRQWLHRT